MSVTAIESRRIEVATAKVEHEVRSAMDRFPEFNSPHEGWAVIREELDELWEHVKANTGRTPDAFIEAVQVAAMAVRYAVDLCDYATASSQPGPE